MSDLAMLGAYFVFVVLGVGGIYWLLHHLGQGTDISVKEDAARDVLAKYEPEAKVVEIVELQTSVLMRLEGGAIAVARGFGHRPTVHVFPLEDVSAVQDVPGAVVLKLKDFTIPNLRLATTNPNTVRRFLNVEE